MLALSVLAIITLSADVIFPMSSDSRAIIQYADTLICGLFFLDFLVMLYSAESRGKYLITWGWLDLLSSVPMVNALRWGRLARIARILRVLRGIRSARVLTCFILERRAQSAFLAAVLVSIILVTVSAVSILQFETKPEANIKTAEDAVWWAVVTITTVGYGDKFPVTSEGRIIAAILMAAGVGLFGTLSGFVTAWFLSPVQGSAEADLKRIEIELRELRKLLEEKGKVA
jgi:voltage-gated potassium channel